MKCPHCKKEIKNINVISECWQKGIVDKKGTIDSVGEVEEILETVIIEHRDNYCFANITDLIKSKSYFSGKLL